METATFPGLLSLLSSLALGFVGGLTSGLGLRWLVGRRCFRLEVAVADLQQVVKSMKGYEYATTHREKKKSLQSELEGFRLPESVPRRRFDNDAFVGGPHGE